MYPEIDNVMQKSLPDYRIHAFVVVRTILKEQRASILGQQSRIFMDRFQICFQLIVDAMDRL